MQVSSIFLLLLAFPSPLLPLPCSATPVFILLFIFSGVKSCHNTSPFPLVTSCHLTYDPSGWPPTAVSTYIHKIRNQSKPTQSHPLTHTHTEARAYSRLAFSRLCKLCRRSHVNFLPYDRTDE
jgi:hypothetical protein